MLLSRRRKLKAAYFLIVTLDLVTRHTLFYRTLFMQIPSFSSKRGHVGEKHVLIGGKRDKLGNQTCEV